MTDDQIDEFDAIHGLGAYERCAFAAKRVRGSKNLFADNDAMRRGLEKQGIPAALAGAYSDIVSPKPALRRMTSVVHSRSFRKV